MHYVLTLREYTTSVLIYMSWQLMKILPYFFICEGHGNISQQNKQIFNISNAPNILIVTVSNSF
jgi:hypothetical protein